MASGDKNRVRKLITRREFIKKSASLTGQAFIASNFGGLFLAGCQLPNVPTKKERHKAVIIGSGFGGAIAAYHLAKAGIETIVLERGRRWPIQADGNTFPKFNHPDKRAAWLSPMTVFPDAPPGIFKPYVGLIERVEGQGIDVIVGAGVGGSSLVYGGMMLKPPRDLFYKVFPPDVDYDELDRIYYPRVKSMIGIDTIPDDILSSHPYQSTRVFLDHARKAGLNGERINDAVNWNMIRDELTGKVIPSATVGESIYGMNSGCKNSVDHNYLAQAEKSGHVQIYPLHIVQEMIDSGSNTYIVQANEIDENGTVLNQKIITCDYLFLAAGSMGTSKLLVKAKARGTLSKLNEYTGLGWANNGDRLYMRMGLAEETLAYQGGPACAAIFDPGNPKGPVTLEHGPGPLPIELHAMPILGMGIPEGRGQFIYDRANDSATLHWSSHNDEKSLDAINSTLDILNDATGGFNIDMNAVGGAFTFHPLGGMVLGQACDWYGRVQGYKRLYVVDASLIPGSAACCNPAWTVAALAERCMDRIVAEDIMAK